MLTPVADLVLERKLNKQEIMFLSATQRVLEFRQKQVETYMQHGPISLIIPRPGEAFNGGILDPVQRDTIPSMKDMITFSPGQRVIDLDIIPSMKDRLDGSARRPGNGRFFSPEQVGKIET